MPTTVTVSNLAELYGALKASTGGETILLAGGDYGNLSLSAKSYMDLNFEGVTLASADPGNPAVFSGMNLTGVSNLAIDSVVFDYNYKDGDASYLRPFQVNSSTGITIRNSVFDGDVASGVSETADGYGWAYGLSVRGSTGVTIDNNEFHSWLRGAVFDGSKDLTVTGNEVHDIRSDGMDFANVQDVRIEDNHFHDFRASYASGDHRDMIQFWTNGTNQATTDVVIRGNLFDIGEGSYTQSIFMRNEEVDTGRAGTEMYYQNVLIEDNTIYNSHLHGITVGETAGLIIRGNSLIAVQDPHNPAASSSAMWVPTIRVAGSSTGVEITGNAAAAIAGPAGQAGWTVQGNAFIQNSDPFAPGHYSTVFVSSSMGGSGGHAYVALPGGMLDRLDAGSELTRPPEKLEASALYAVTQGDGGLRVFDAGVTAQLLGADDAGARYVWTFGDGTTAQGKVVSHSYAAGSVYDAQLSVILPNGRVLTAGSEVTVSGSAVLSWDAKAHAFVAHAAGADTPLAAVTSLDGGAIQLGAPGTAATVSRGVLSGLRGTDEFGVDFTLQADKAGGSGEVFRLHMGFVATVSATGTLVFQTFDSAGKAVTLESKGLRVNDGAAHDISVTLADGKLLMVIDGATVGQTAFAGTLTTGLNWDLSFGNPWGKANFAGDILDFGISVDAGAYPAKAVTEVIRPDSAQPGPVDPGTELGTGPFPPVDAPPTPPEPVQTAPEPTPPAQPEPTPPTPPAPPATGLLDAKIFDLAGLSGSKVLINNAHVETRSDGPVLVFDGDKDYANLGRQTAYESSDRIAFSVDFTRSGDMVGEERLVWNHLKLGLTLKGDALVVNIATADQGFKGFSASKLNLQDEDLHNAVVMLDAGEDRLQVLLDGKVVIDVDNVDFDIVGAGGREWGWSLGTAWDRFFEGEVSDFRLGDRFDFVGDHAHSWLS